MKLGQILALAAIVVILFVSSLNPGGFIIALILIGLVLAVYAAAEFFPEYILVTNQGKNAKKDRRRKRRARGLNPFSRKSKREGPRQNARTGDTGGDDP